jgi:GTP-binding protein
VSYVKPLGRSLDNAAALNSAGLPEIALAGYSNSGKSSLLNALIGMPAQRGIASVDARAGWTESIFAFHAEVSGTTLALIDTPGYGVAVTTGYSRSRWEQSLERYLDASEHLRCVFILVDCTRGLCALDWRLVRRAERNVIACQVVLTKADLLSPTDLARSHAVVTADLRASSDVRHPQPAMVSSNFTQGVRQIWALARHHALTRAPPGPAVRKQSGRSRARAAEEAEQSAQAEQAAEQLAKQPHE